MRRHRLAAAAALVALIASVADAAAASSSSTSSSGAASTAVAASSSSDDNCSSPVFTDGCWYPVSCSVCLRRSGCALDALTGACVSSASVADRATVGSERYYQADSTSYCDLGDEHCLGYLSGANRGVCNGAGGCIASYQCSLISTRPTACQAVSGGFSEAALIVACGLLVIFVIVLRARTGIDALATFLSASWRKRQARRREALRRAQAEADPSGLHKSLKLENWRRQLGTNTRDLGPIELGGCYIQMPHEDDRATATTDADSLRGSSNARDSVLDMVATPVPTRAGDDDLERLEAASAATAGEHQQH